MKSREGFGWYLGQVVLVRSRVSERPEEGYRLMRISRIVEEGKHGVAVLVVSLEKGEEEELRRAEQKAAGKRGKPEKPAGEPGVRGVLTPEEEPPG